MSVPAPVLAAMLAHVVLSAATFIVAKIALGEFDPLALAQMRMLLAALGLLGVWRVRPPAPPRGAAGPRLTGRDWRALAVLGLVGMPLNQGLFLLGLRRSIPAHGALLYAATPIVVLCLALLRGQERLRWDRGLGVAMAFGGVAFLLFGGGMEFERRWLVGDLLIFVAVVAWAFYTTRSRELVPRLGPLRLTTLATAAGALLFLPAGVPAVLAQDFSRATWAGWASLAYIAFGTSVLSYLIWSWALARIEASRVAIFTNLQPIATALMAWAFLGDPLTLHFLGATAAVLAGVALAERG